MAHAPFTLQQTVQYEQGSRGEAMGFMQQSTQCQVGCIGSACDGMRGHPTYGCRCLDTKPKGMAEIFNALDALIWLSHVEHRKAGILQQEHQ
jgi:hypothetical protein